MNLLVKPTANHLVKINHGFLCDLNTLLSHTELVYLEFQYNKTSDPHKIYNQDSNKQTHIILQDFKVSLSYKCFKFVKFWHFSCL